MADALLAGRIGNQCMALRIVTSLVGFGNIMVTSGIVMTVCAAACLALTLRSGIREPDLG
jgi:hypothetical protein